MGTEHADGAAKEERHGLGGRGGDGGAAAKEGDVQSEAEVPICFSTREGCCWRCYHSADVEKRPCIVSVFVSATAGESE